MSDADMVLEAEEGVTEGERKLAQAVLARAFDDLVILAEYGSWRAAPQHYQKVSGVMPFSCDPANTATWIEANAKHTEPGGFGFWCAVCRTDGVSVAREFFRRAGLPIPERLRVGAA